MDTTEIIDAGFWGDSSCQVMVNERDASAVAEAAAIRDWVKHQNELVGHVIFATSGSSGSRKWVAVSRGALLASARAVNTHLGVDSSDRWLLALPTFHVGGMGILARCHEASCDCVCYDGKWDPALYHALCSAQNITLSSMVPTQLVDIVQWGLSSPPSIRAVLIGGGRLDEVTYQKAIDLGWPVIETYGMTETCSQVATATLGCRDLKILAPWQAQIDGAGRLMLKGESVLTGYVIFEGGDVSMTDPKEDGWFLTGDRVEVSGRVLTVKGRVDRCVKILGELVSLDDVEREVAGFTSIEASQIVVIAIDDTRKGSRLILYTEGVEVSPSFLSDFNQQCHPLHRIDSVKMVEVFPRSPLGKILYHDV